MRKIILLLGCSCFFFFCKETPNTSPLTSFDGTKIVFTDEGKGKPVFLLHGFINTRKNWDKSTLKKDLLTAGYRVIAPCLK